MDFAAFFAVNAGNIYIFYILEGERRHKIMANSEACGVGIREDYHAVFLRHAADKSHSLLIIVYIKSAEFKNICFKERSKAYLIVLALDDTCFLDFYFL